MNDSQELGGGGKFAFKANALNWLIAHPWIKTPDGFNTMNEEEIQRWLEKAMEEANNGQNDNDQKEEKFSTIARSAMEAVRPYIKGIETTFRTISFGLLEESEKMGVYKTLIGVINKINLILDENQKVKINNFLNGKIRLVGENGLSYENSELRIGPVAKAEDVLMIIKENAFKDNQNEGKNGQITGEPLVENVQKKPEEILKNEEWKSWDEGEEWQRFISDRKEAFAAQFRIDENRGIENADDKKKIEEIEKKREEMKNFISSAIRRERGYDNLSDEDKRKLDVEIRRTISKKLVEEDNQAYLTMLRANKKETTVDKLRLEALKALKSKAVQWYLGLSKNKRMAVNFALGSTVGLVAGAAGSVGVASYLGWRVARFGASALSGTAAGEWANKKWSVEELNQKEKEEKDALAESDLSLVEQKKGLEEINERYQKERTKAVTKRMLVTVGAGAGAGLLAGLVENIVGNLGSSNATDFLEAKDSKTGVLENKLPPRKGYAPPETKTSENMTKVPKMVESEKIISNEKDFKDPSVVKHEVVRGDSVWKILKDTLENYQEFKNIKGNGTAEEIAKQIEAKQTRILQLYTMEVLKNHQQYDIGSNGEIKIGQEIDFSKLFENREKFEAIIEEAESLDQEKINSIVLNNDKIEQWLKDNPNKPFSNEEIFSSKPKAIPEPLGNSDKSFSETDEIRAKKIGEITKEENPEINNDVSKSRLAEKPDLYRDGELINEASILRQSADLAQASSKKLDFENNNAKPEQISGLRTMSRDVAEITARLNNAFGEEIDRIYGKSGFLGIGSVRGVDTAEWKEMGRLPADKVLKYFTGDSSESGLPIEIVKKLAESKKHTALMEQIVGLMEKSDNVIRPNPSENVSDFVKRLGAHIMRSHMQTNLQDSKVA